MLPVRNRVARPAGISERRFVQGRDLLICRAGAADRRWIAELAALVYGNLGDYGSIIPSWLDHPGVLTYLERGERGGPRRGFVLVGFYEPRDGAPGECVADLLALAVHPLFQGRGIGRTLLNHAIHVAEMAGHTAGVREMRLTVADDNTIGKRLYSASGFRILDPRYGVYDGGQRAIRMARPLRGSRAPAHNPRRPAP